jgi:hypothetical protein
MQSFVFCLVTIGEACILGSQLGVLAAWPNAMRSLARLQ